MMTCVQRLLCTVEEAHTLRADPGGRVAGRNSARHLVRPLCWPNAPLDCRGLATCNAGHACSKGLVKRQVISLVGPLRWGVGSTVSPDARPAGAPLDDALGLHFISGPVVSSSTWAVPWRSCAICHRGYAAGLGERGGGSPRAVWEWGQAAGQRAMAQLQAQLQAAEGHLLPRSPWRPRWRRCLWPWGPMG